MKHCLIVFDDILEKRQKNYFPSSPVESKKNLLCNIHHHDVSSCWYEIETKGILSFC